LIPAEYQDAAVLRTPTQMRAGGVRVLRDAHTEPPAAGQRAALIDEGVDGLVMSLLTQKPGEADEIIAKLRPLGDVAIHVLGERFPGPLWWNPESGVVPNGAGISAVSYALSEFGAAAFYAMRHHLESSDPVNRLCALAWAGYVLEDDELIPWLGRRIFDVDQSVRDVALELLCRRSECGAEYEASLSAIRATARVHRPQSDLRAVAIRALGQLRDVQALGLLIDLLGDLEPAIAQSAHSALVMISGNDFGSVPREWWRWTDNHGSEPRIQWLIAGLDAEREATRQHAAQEIERLTNHYVGYHPALPPEERLRCQNDYRSWWESHGDSSA